MIRTITVSLIILLSLLSLYFFTISNKLAFYTTILVNITVITFSILIWLEDRDHKEEVSQRVISFPVKEMIKDIVLAIKGIKFIRFLTQNFLPPWSSYSMSSYPMEISHRRYITFILLN